MADAYNVRSDGKFYYVYRLDGNVQVSQHATSAEAQRSAAIQNQRFDEQMAKKKRSAGDASKVPDPPPGQGASY